MELIKKLMILTMTMMLAFACSSSQEGNESGDDLLGDDQAEVSDELLEDDLDNSEIIVDDDTEELILEEPGTEVAESLEESLDQIQEDSAAMVTDAAQAATMQIDTSGGGSGTHTVQKGETLMLIAWKIYGDYTKWHQIARLNGLTSAQAANLSAGTALRYNAPAQQFVWNPEGEPYLILRGDTLGRISNKVYGTMGKWRSIWDNNRPLIKDPNLIFAGFTLYYVPDGKVAMK